MGAQSAHTLNEITEIRSRLDSRMEELGYRLPASLENARNIAGMVAAVGGIGTVFGVIRKLKGSKKRGAPSLPQQVTIQVLPKATLPVAAAVALAFVGLRVWESTRSQATVQPLRSTDR